MRGKVSEQNVNWKTSVFIASNYITWQDKIRKMSAIERFIFRRKDRERARETERALIGRVCKLYFCLPESDLENRISWGEGRVSLSIELLNSLDGKTQPEERKVKITTCAISGEEAFGIDLTVKLDGRAIEFSVDRKHKIKIKQRTENGRKKYNPTEPWMLLEQAIKVGEKIIALSN